LRYFGATVVESFPPPVLPRSSVYTGPIRPRPPLCAPVSPCEKEDAHAGRKATEKRPSSSLQGPSPAPCSPRCRRVSGNPLHTGASPSRSGSPTAYPPPARERGGKRTTSTISLRLLAHAEEKTSRSRSRAPGLPTHDIRIKNGLRASVFALLTNLFTKHPLFRQRHPRRPAPDRSTRGADTWERRVPRMALRAVSLLVVRC